MPNKPYRTGCLATRNAQIAFQRRNLLQRGLYRGIGWHVSSFWQSGEPCFGWTSSCKSKGRIFRVYPAKQRATFLGARCDERDAGWRRQKRDRWRIDDLKDVKAESVRDQRKRQKKCDRNFSAPRRIPAKNKWFGCALRDDAIHRGGLAANATEVMPCSSAAFATSATVS